MICNSVSFVQLNVFRNYSNSLWNTANFYPVVETKINFWNINLFKKQWSCTHDCVFIELDIRNAAFLFFGFVERGKTVSWRMAIPISLDVNVAKNCHCELFMKRKKWTTVYDSPSSWSNRTSFGVHICTELIEGNVNLIILMF